MLEIEQKRLSSKNKNENDLKDKTFFLKLGAYESNPENNPLNWYTSDSANGEISKISKLHAKMQKYLKSKPKDNDYKWDDVFWEYLVEMSKKVTSKFYKVLTLYIDNYRLCMNEYGGDLINLYKRVNTNENTDKDQFISAKNPSSLPEIANIFIQKYLPTKIPKFDRKIAIDLTKHFWDWLVIKNYTNVALKSND